MSSRSSGRCGGLTPAGAGTAVRLVHRVTGKGAGPGSHPRQARGRPEGAGPDEPVAWAHPRRRGDGSWPPTSRPRTAGLTPAGAGTAMGGRHATGRPSGSPPQARGRQERCVSEREQAGLTPADAGTARQRASHPHASGAHPRRRGDGDGVTIKFRMAEGSPPQARGRRERCATGGRRPGLTPAGAGTARRA